jgi:short-subunit dehydrogenase
MSKVIFITGASSGLGKAMASYLISKNYIVYGTSRNPEKVKDVDFPLIKMDVNDEASIRDGVSELLSKTKRIDVLINNAGIGITGPMEEIPIAEMEKSFSTNFYGPLRVTKAVLPTMRAQKSGLIINITSIAGYMGLPYRGIYSATKAALEIAMEAMRMEVAPFNIKMTNVAPGDFATNITERRYHAPVLDDSPYKHSYQMSLELMNQHVHSGENPMKLAVEIFKIINTENPKVHYKVGSFTQKFSIVLKKIVPDKTYEKMLKKHFKLDK